MVVEGGETEAAAAAGGDLEDEVMAALNPTEPELSEVETGEDDMEL